MLVLGSPSPHTDKGTGLGIISQFGHFGSVPTDTGSHLSWSWRSKMPTVSAGFAN